MFYILWGTLMLIAGYLLIVMIIFFCVSMKKSVFFNMPVSGLLAFLVACVCIYIVSLLQLVLTPFGTIETFGLMIILTLHSKTGLLFYALLLLLEAAGLFVITSKLIERRINI
jgi:hypothetical protein